MYLRGQSQPEEEETGKEWKVLKGTGAQDKGAGTGHTLGQLGDEDYSGPALESPLIHRKKVLLCTSPSQVLER